MSKYKSIYKKYLIIKYYISKPFIFLFKKIPHFILNIWLFRKELLHFEHWDWVFPLSMFRRSIEIEHNFINKHGTEDIEIKTKKLNMMRRAINIMLVHESDLFLDVAEKELGYDYKIELYDKENKNTLTYNDKEKNTALVKRSMEIEYKLWIELLNILNGQDLSNVKSDSEWTKKYDGSGFKTWWD